MLASLAIDVWMPETMDIFGCSVLKVFIPLNGCILMEMVRFTGLHFRQCAISFRLQVIFLLASQETPLMNLSADSQKLQSSHRNSKNN